MLRFLGQFFNPLACGAWALQVTINRMLHTELVEIEDVIVVMVCVCVYVYVCVCVQNLEFSDSARLAG